MSKININSHLRYAYRITLADQLRRRPDEYAIVRLLGPVIRAVQDVVEHRIDLFGSATVSTGEALLAGLHQIGQRAEIDHRTSARGRLPGELALDPDRPEPCGQRAAHVSLEIVAGVEDLAGRKIEPFARGAEHRRVGLGDADVMGGHAADEPVRDTREFQVGVPVGDRQERDPGGEAVERRGGVGVELDPLARGEDDREGRVGERRVLTGGLEQVGEGRAPERANVVREVIAILPHRSERLLDRGLLVAGGGPRGTLGEERVKCLADPDGHRCERPERVVQVEGDGADRAGAFGSGHEGAGAATVPAADPSPTACGRRASGPR